MSNPIADEIKKRVVNDYFTPNIKAEVILDALLTPYIVDIVKDQCKNKINGELHFVTKEMSIKEQEKEEQKGNRGTKIDYILADDENVYLVELKTVSTSIDRNQAVEYVKNLVKNEKGQSTTFTFGEVLGEKLVNIMGGNKEDYSVEGLHKILCRRFSKYGCQLSDGEYAEQARKLLKKKNLYSTNKYLYTMGQILDYVYEDKDKPRKIWDKKLKLIYITPDGGRILPTKVKPIGWESLYVKANCTESISLKNSLPKLEKLKKEKEEKKENEENRGWEYIDLLISIIKELYLKEEEAKHD